MTIYSGMPCWFYEKRDLRRSPSIRAGLSIEKECRYRREGARFIISIGTKMGLRYDTMATGVVYFHRFYMFHSFQTFPRYITACCCLFLAGKVEETPKKCKDIIKVAKSFLTDAQFSQFGEDPKEEVMTLERILLQTIKFDLQVDHPYGHLLRYAKCLKGDKAKLEKMVQMAWTFINDSLCTTLCLQWEPEVIAIALMYLAGKLSKFEVVDWVGRIPRHSNWWDMYVQGMTIDLLEDICHQVLDLYSMPVPETPADSPPATPPTKTSIRKVNSASPGTPSSPVVPAVPAAPVLPSVPIIVRRADPGRPIPRVEGGQKIAKAIIKCESTPEIVLPRDPPPPKKTAAVTVSASVSTACSPMKSVDEVETKTHTPEPADVKKPPPAAQFIPTIETTYHTGVSALPPPQPMQSVIQKAEPIKNIVTKSNVEPIHVPVITDKKSNQLHNPPFIPDVNEPFFADSHPQPPIPHPPFPQNVSFVAPPPIPPARDPTLIQVPPARPPPAQFEEMYRPPIVPQVQPPPLPPPPQTQYLPPPVPNIRPMNQFSTPPPPVPTLQPSMLPNVSLPPPNMTQIPPMSAVPPNVRNEHIRGPAPPRLSGPPPPNISHGMVPPSPQNVNPRGPLPPPPSHFMPRPEPEPYGRDHRNEEHLPNQRNMPLPAHCPPPRYLREGPPPPPAHGEYPPPRNPYDMERPGPHFCQDPEYERDHHRDTYMDYEDYGPTRVPSHPYEYDNMMRRRYNMESPQHHHPQRNLERGPPPMMMNNRPRMESPTGIPPVRITGSSFDRYPE